MHRMAKLRTELGTFPVVMGEPGRKYTKYVRVGYPVRVRKLSNAEAARYASNLDYPIKRACRRMLKFGAHGNITKEARNFLKEAMV